MAELAGRRVCLSGNGRGAIAAGLRKRLTSLGVVWVDDVPDGPQPPADIALCTSGRLLIRDAAHVAPEDVDRLYDANYRYPRLFLERHVAAMRASGVAGHIVLLGSNAALYGNVGAEDYAACKAALRKYVEIRGRSLREAGIRLTLLNFGAVATAFWDKATADADPALLGAICPDRDRALTVDEAVETVLAILQVPPRVVVKEALVVSVAYQ